MAIPILDLSTEVKELWGELNDALQRVLRSGQFVLGSEVAELEKEVAATLGVEHAIGVNSGTDALVIGLRALGVGPGDEVITTSFTFVATAEAVSLLGATPVFVDIDPASLNLDPAAIEAAITPRTKGILPVHLFGHAAEMDPILETARRHGLFVLEDVAQAFGGRYRGRTAGTMGEVSAFSFFPTKNLGAYGDAGLIVARDAAAAELCRMLRTHGSRKRYVNEMLGYNSRLDALQAAILRVKLPHVNAWNEARRKAAALYTELLSGVDGVVTPSVAPHVEHVFHQYTLRIRAGKRDVVHQRMAERGVSTMIYYPIPVHRLQIYADRGISLPRTEQAASEVLSLPIWPQIEPATQRKVVSTLVEALG
jgi:dTDP-4-amino-4,6-dideoxygalactose transaminase